MLYVQICHEMLKVEFDERRGGKYYVLFITDKSLVTCTRYWFTEYLIFFGGGGV